jgi:KDO2-lipid IV(A) lauroyltransferase
MAKQKPKKKRSYVKWLSRRSRRVLRAAFQWLRYRVGEYCLRGFIRALPRIPPRLVDLFTAGAEKATFTLLRKYRARMEDNITLAMSGEFPLPEQRRALVRRIWSNLSKGLLETLWMMHASKAEIVGRIALDGEEHLQRALAAGKGVIALSAHLGNFTMIGARLAAAGYSFTALVKHPGDRRFAQLINDYRAQLGIQTISAKPRREAVRGILKALRANSIVLVIADEFKSEGIEVDFFGRRSPVPRGPATIALRTGAATLPMFATRDDQGRLTLSIGPRIELIDRGDREQNVAANTALFTQHLEAAVRRYPDQWNWLGFYRDGREPRMARHRALRRQHKARRAASSAEASPKQDSAR